VERTWPLPEDTSNNLKTPEMTSRISLEIPVPAGNPLVVDAEDLQDDPGNSGYDRLNEVPSGSSLRWGNPLKLRGLILSGARAMCVNARL
jgi:hypothetical protein